VVAFRAVASIGCLPLGEAGLSENHTHYPALDGVRGMAVLIVIGAHTHPQVLPGGNIGVDLFFVLSGFLITTLLLNEQKRAR